MGTIVQALNNWGLALQVIVIIISSENHELVLMFLSFTYGSYVAFELCLRYTYLLLIKNAI